MYQHSHSALVIMCLSQLLDQASNKLNFVRSLSPGTLTVHLGIFCFWKMTSYETCSGWISKSIFLEAYLVQKVTVTVSSCFGLVTFGLCTLVLECKFLVLAVFPKYFYKNTRHFYNNKVFKAVFFRKRLQATDHSGHTLIRTDATPVLLDCTCVCHPFCGWPCYLSSGSHSACEATTADVGKQAKFTFVTG